MEPTACVQQRGSLAEAPRIMMLGDAAFTS